MQFKEIYSEFVRKYSCLVDKTRTGLHTEIRPEMSGENLLKKPLSRMERRLTGSGKLLTCPA